MRKLAMVAAAACMWSQTALADWVKAESDNFIVYSELEQEKVERFLQNLEQYRRYLERIAKPPEDADTLRLTIFIAKDMRSYDKLAGGDGSAGKFHTGREGPTAALSFHDDGGKKRGREGSIRNRLQKNVEWQTGEQVLFHEFVHFMQYLGTPAYYPLWYQEGFAEFLSSVMFDENNMYFGRVLEGRAYGLQFHGRWVSAEELLERRSYGFRNGMFYAQAWLLTHMLYNDAEFQKGLGNFIKLLQHEIHPEEALNYVYGIGYQELDKKLHKYFRDKKFDARGMPLDKKFKAKVSFETLSEKEQELVEQTVQLNFMGGKKKMRSLAARAEKAASKYGESPEFGRIQVRALGDAEDWDKALETAEALVKKFPNSAIAQAAFGKLLISSEQMAMRKAEHDADKEKDSSHQDEEVQDSESTYELDKEKLSKGIELLKEAADHLPNDPEVFTLLGFALLESDSVTREDSRYLKHVYDIYPQSREVRRLYGDYLVEDDDFEKACKVLLPIYHTTYSLKQAKELRKIILEFPNSEEACPLGGLRPMEVEGMEKNADK